MTPARFPLAARPRRRRRAAGPTSLAADIPIALQLGAVRLTANGLLDPTAAVSVLPHKLGLRLGAVWTGHTIPIRANASKWRGTLAQA